MSVWLTIDTAPKDGTRVILFHKPEMIGIGYWGRNGHYNPLGWLTHSSSGGYINHIDQPTHWMPLPPPPVSRSP